MEKVKDVVAIFSNKTEIGISNVYGSMLAFDYTSPDAKIYKENIDDMEVVFVEALGKDLVCITAKEGR